jgi:hypothetical protein
MIYTLSYLINALIIGFLCTAIGYIIGRARGMRKSRQELIKELPYLIYNRES